MEIVINTCFGGFGLSPAGIKRLAELQGRPCYFFVNPREPKLDLYAHVLATMEEATKAFTFCAYDIPNPDEALPSSRNWHEKTEAQRAESNRLWTEHSISDDLERNDPLLVQIVRELGDAANGKGAKLAIVEMPDGTDWEISEYDGREHIAEKHQTWS